MTDDGLTQMERFMAAMGLHVDGDEFSFQMKVPDGLTVSQAQRNAELLKTRLPWYRPENMPEGTRPLLMTQSMQSAVLEFFSWKDVEKPCDMLFFGNLKLNVDDNIWVSHDGNFFYGLEVEDGFHGRKTTARKFCGDKDPRNVWVYRDSPTVPVGFTGWTPEEFGWQMDGFRLQDGLTARVAGVAYPVYMHLWRPQGRGW